MNTYWVYILTNDYNTVFYIGVTNNIHRRMYEHKNRLLNGFSKQYNLKNLFTSIQQMMYPKHYPMKRD